MRIFLVLLALLVATTSFAKTTVLNRRILPGQTMARALYDAQLDAPTVDRLISALEGVFDCRRSRDGDQFRLALRDGVLENFDYRQGPLDEWQVRVDGDRLVASKRSVEVEKRIEVVQIDVESSLYDAAKTAGEDPIIAMALSDVFAWDIDFYRDVQRGDRVKAVVEKFVSKGRLVRYGNVLAASFNGSTVGKKQVLATSCPAETRRTFSTAELRREKRSSRAR